MRIFNKLPCRPFLAGLAVALFCSGSALAQQRVMVTGDSISAGQDRPSYRQPLLDALDDYNCPVNMVGDQTLNSYDYRNPTTSPGSHFPGFTAANGYDVDHQAFPAITVDRLSDGVTSEAADVQPISAYVLEEQPDYVLVHLGTNDLTQGLNTGISSDSQINTWATTTTNEMKTFIDRVIGASQSPNDIKVLVANFIPYDLFADSAARRSIAQRASTVYTRKLEEMVESQARSQILLVDVATGFNPTSMTTDGIHPNAAGEQHLAGAFLPVLRGAGLCQSGTPTIISPDVGGVVLGDSVNFQWDDNGVNATSWRIRAGNSQSGSSSTYFDSGNLSASARSVNITGLPVDGSNVFVSVQYNSSDGLDLVFASFISKPDSGQEQAPGLTNPAPGSVLTSASPVLNWATNGTAVTQWWVRVGSSVGGTQYFDSGRIFDSSTRSMAVSGLPTDGSTVHVELTWKTPAGPWELEHSTFTAVNSGSGTGGSTGGNTDGGTTDGTTDGGSTSNVPALTSPAVGSTLSGSTATLNWATNGASAIQWWVRVGSSVGGTQYFDSGRILDASQRSINVTGLPTDGSTVHVELTWKTPAGPWELQHATYKAASSGGTTGSTTSGGTTTGTTDGGTSTGGTTDGGSTSNVPALTSPTVGSTLSGSSATLNWATNGASAIQWWVRVGSSQGGTQYFDSGRILDASQRSINVTGLPTDGSTVHVELTWKTPAGPWELQHATYKAASSGGTTGSTTSGGTTTGTTDGGTTGGTSTGGTTDGGSTSNVPALTSPTVGSTLSGSSATLNWATNGASAIQWWVRVGSSQGGTQYFDSGRILDASQRSINVTGLPTNGSTVHVELTWKTPAGPWELQHATYKAASSGGTTGTTTGSTSGGTTTGTTDGGTTGGTSTGGTTDGGSTSNVPALTSPTVGSTLSGSSATLNWATNGASAIQWWVRVGSSQGGTQYFDSGRITNASQRSINVTGLPTNGSTVHVELTWKTPAGPWELQHATYKAASSGGTSGGTTTGSTDGGTTGGSSTGGTSTGGTSSPDPQILTPAAGSTLNGPTATLSWTPNSTEVIQWWVRVGSSAGAQDLFDSGRITSASARSQVMTGLPTNGSPVYVRLLYKKTIGGWGIIDKVYNN